MSKVTLRAQQALTLLLVLAIIGLAGWLSTQYKQDFDWTAGKRNSLSAASVKQLALLKKPVSITAFAPTGSENRADILQFFERYKAAKKDLTLKFVDPIKNPDQVRQLNVQAAGDLVVEYEDRRELVPYERMNEAQVTQALQRLGHNDARFLVFLTGHGEHDLAAPGAAGYASLVEELKRNGLTAQSLNLAATPSIPDNAAAVVVAGAHAPLLAGEVALIEKYLAAGGSLLWMTDPDAQPLPESIAKLVGTQFAKGTAVFPEFAQLSQDPGLFVTLDYPRTPVTADVSENALFPVVTSINSLPDGAGGFTPTPFLQSSQYAWLEAGPLEGEIGFEPAQGDVQGPLTLGTLLQRNQPGAKAPAAKDPTADAPALPQQRVALVGDSDWLANAQIPTEGNRKLGLNLLRWLGGRDEQLGINVPEAQDQTLSTTPAMSLALKLTFLVAVPLLLLAVGITRWWMRRRR